MADVYRPRGSSSISEVTYGTDDAEDDMLVVFTTGNEYVYHGVPQGVFEGLKAASSAGQYLDRQVKGRYDYEQV